ncbi:hypothetical protein K0817_003290 [Microbacterium sp. HD4P20]|uniref:hypothetical protein n=1 Tax=Microbacterium sp. HD4P20 TaxID=2864874 RepID=UPI0020A555DB|nr:hypothetical protein [Microbacterium sp. HD4P20]MCP2635587.1 hypothetical protein [Microbacterium sp. HD4P20]
MPRPRRGSGCAMFARGLGPLLHENTTRRVSRGDTVDETPGMENALVSEPMQAEPRTKTDTLWRVIIIAIFVIGVVVAIGFPLLNGNWRSVFSAVPVFAFGILIAAIRSIRH